MSEITLGEIRLFPYPNVVPAGWLPCEGQLLSVQTYVALFSLLGTRFGGDGKVNFALPDLRGRTPVHFGIKPDPNRIGSPSGLQEGSAGGSETVTLTTPQMPAHAHSFAAEPSNATSPALTNSVPSTSVKQANASPTAPAAPNIYAPASGPGTLVAVNPQFIGNEGGGGGHENRQPYLSLGFYICATNGYYPQRN